MRCYGLICAVLLCTCFLLAPRVSVGNDDAMCDFYDFHGRYIVSFPKGTQLGKGAPSNLSGITFLFPGGEKLLVVPELGLYSPVFSDPGELSDMEKFVKEYNKEGCTVGPAQWYPGITVTCPDYEYSMMPTNNQQETIYVQVFYDFKDKASYPQYKKIMESLFIVPREAEDFYDEGKQANAEYLFAQNDEFQQAWADYKMPSFTCGKYRVRNKFVP